MNSFTGIFQGFYLDFKNTVLSPLPCYHAPPCIDLSLTIRFWRPFPPPIGGELQSTNRKTDVVTPRTIIFATKRSSKEIHSNVKNIVTLALKVISRIPFFKQWHKALMSTEISCKSAMELLEHRHFFVICAIYFLQENFFF